MNYTVVTLELITALIATYYYQKYKQSSEKHFMHFLWFTFIIDFFFGSFVALVLNKNNSWVYNIYIFVSFLFYLSWYYKIIRKKLFKKIILILLTFFVLLDIYSFIVEGNENYHEKAFVFGALMNLIATLLYFYELLTSKDIIHIKYKLSFWIATALLLFNVGMIPFFLYSKEIIESNESLYQVILNSFNLILYTCYSIGFIWSKKEYNQY